MFAADWRAAHDSVALLLVDTSRALYARQSPSTWGGASSSSAAARHGWGRCGCRPLLLLLLLVLPLMLLLVPPPQRRGAAAGLPSIAAAPGPPTARLSCRLNSRSPLHYVPR